MCPLFWYYGYSDTIEQHLALLLRATIALERVAATLEKAR